MPRPVPQGSSSSLFTVVGESADHVLAVYENVLMVLWRGQQQAAVCATLYDTAVRVARAQGVAQVAVISVVGASARPPSKESRDALARLYADPSGVVHRVAVVLPGGGFLEAGIRSIVIGLQQMVTHNRAQEVFRSIDKALVWATSGLTTSHGKPIALSALVAELTALQSGNQPSR